MKERNSGVDLAKAVAIFLHKIGSVISYSADNLVISASLGLVAIAVYGNYYYVYTAVGGIVYVVFNSLTAGFGNTIRTESVADNFARFMKANRLSMLVIAWCTAYSSRSCASGWANRSPSLFSTFSRQS